ncbi:MAG: hypothetical protein GY803_26475 [Chloroflexi bacterium]|nr:hypothetical protein [Chloroflexota bacterium]
MSDPIEQKTVDFYGDELTAVRADDGHVYVAIGQMCDALGLDRASQARRIRSNEILADGYRGSVKLTYPGGGTQASGVLRVDLIPLWLTGVRLKAVRDEIQPKLRRFQLEAARVLWEAFQDGRLTADTAFDSLLANASADMVDAYQTALAIVKLARNQIILESRIDSHERQLAAHGDRLEEVEDALGLSGEEPAVTQAQASQISQAVKAVAIALGKRTKRNEFGGVYGEMYRKYDVTSYKLIPASKFRAVMSWLNEWYQEVAPEG